MADDEFEATVRALSQAHDQQRVTTINSSPNGSGYRDGGILDFGREHAYLDELGSCVIVLPQGLVNFIQRQGQRSEQQGGDVRRGSRRDTGTSDGQTQEGKAAAASNGAGVARPDDPTGCH